jgi:hypothetical protein
VKSPADGCLTTKTPWPVAVQQVRSHAEQGGDWTEAERHPANVLATRGAGTNPKRQAKAQNLARSRKKYRLPQIPLLKPTTDLLTGGCPFILQILPDPLAGGPKGKWANGSGISTHRRTGGKMPEQGSLFSPGSGGRETPTIHERLLSRTTDPATSKRAARKIVTKLTASQHDAWLLVSRFGPGTCMEIAKRAAQIGGGDATVLYHQLARRCPEMHPWYLDVERAGGVDVTRNGARVWRIAT